MKLLAYLRRKQPSKMEQNRIVRYSLIICLLVAFPIGLLLGMEFIQRGSLTEALAWIVQHQSLAIMNGTLILLVLLFCYCLFGSLITGAAVSSLLLFVMALVSYFKTKLIGEPFFPWDIFLKKESMNIIPLVTGASAFKRIAAIFVAFVVLLALRWVMPRLRLHWVSRIVIGVLSLLALYSFGMRTPWAGQWMDRMGASEIVWDQKQNYSDNGMALAFTMNVKNTVVAKPEGYSEPSMAAVAQNIAATQTAMTVSTNETKTPFQGKQPNVIFIMNEAFWDPTLLPNVKFSEDPVPTIHQLQKESTSGYLLSPQFGGGTSNVEYEVLSGNSMSFLPSGSVPYQQYISKPLPSLASYFENKDYKSMAIHSYEGWFWNRENVYKQMGFESFKSKDHFDSPEYKGFFISDDEVSRSIIQEVDNTEKPMFIYAVTMQNHGPYDDDTRYKDGNPIKAEGNLTNDARKILETYTHGAHDADQSLKMLIDHFKESDEPTVIVFYGDHLPMLGLDYDVYKQGGLIGASGQWSLEENKKMHSVPFVMWSNMQLPKQQVPSLSDSFLGSFVLDTLQMEKPAAFALGDQLRQQTPGLLRDLVVDASGGLHQTVPEGSQDLVNQYRELQYDLLFGKQFLSKYIDQDYLTKSALPNYNAEFDDTKLPPTDPADPGGRVGS